MNETIPKEEQIKVIEGQIKRLQTIKNRALKTIANAEPKLKEAEVRLKQLKEVKA